MVPLTKRLMQFDRGVLTAQRFIPAHLGDRNTLARSIAVVGNLDRLHHSESHNHARILSGFLHVMSSVNNPNPPVIEQELYAIRRLPCVYAQ